MLINWIIYVRICLVSVIIFGGYGKYKFTKRNNFPGAYSSKQHWTYYVNEKGDPQTEQGKW